MIISLIPVEVKDNKVRSIVVADSKSDIVPDIHYNTGKVVSAGSLAVTTAFEMAMLGSDGSWHWKE